MLPPPVSGGPVLSKVMLVGQAPGVKEPVLQRPFAWTAGRTLFGWFRQFCGMTEEQVRAFRLLVNRSATWAEWDLDAVAKEITELSKTDFDLHLTGFDAAEIEDFLAPMFYE